MSRSYQEMEITREDARRYAKGITIMNNMAEFLHAQRLLPERFSAPKRQTAPAIETHKPPTSQDLLSQPVREYDKGPLTPGLVTAVFQTIWQVRGESIGQGFSVTPCDRTQEELAQLVENGRRIGYLPDPLKTQQDRPLLAKMFPRMQSYSLQEENPVKNGANRSGWFDYEASIDAPYHDTTEQGLRDKITSEAERVQRELLEMNLNEYVIAGQDSRLFTGKYLDQNSTWSRLLGSRDEGGVVDADFRPGGRLNVHWHLFSQVHDPSLGGRSVGVKKA